MNVPPRTGSLVVIDGSGDPVKVRKVVNHVLVLASNGQCYPITRLEPVVK